MDSTNTTSSSDADRILALLTEQRDLYRRLKSQADQQRAVITGNEPERLLEILVERKRVLDRLNVVGAALKPYQSRWDSLRQELAPGRAALASELLEEVNALLRGIIEQDDADVQLLATRKAATSQAVRSVKTQKQAGAAYQAAGNAATSRSEWTSE